MADYSFMISGFPFANVKINRKGKIELSDKTDIIEVVEAERL